MMTNVDYFKDTIWREYHRWRSDWTLKFITSVAPLPGFILVAWIFSASVPRELPVAVVDLDQTALSRQITRMVDATSIATVNDSYLSLEEARKAIEDGKADAALCIPKGAERNVYRGTSASLALYLNNSNVLKGGLLNSGIRKALSTMSAGIKMQVQMKNGLTRQQAVARVMPVQLHQVLLFNPYTSYSYYLTAGVMPVLLIVCILLTTIYVIGDELYRGTGPAWIRSGGGNFLIALAGKLLPYTVVFVCWALVMDYILFKILGMPLQGKFSIILLSEILMIVAYQCFAIALISLTTNMRLSLSLASAYSMLALTFSGLTFPVMGMSATSQVFSCLFPFTYWIKVLISQSLRGEPWQHGFQFMWPLVVFIVFGLLFVPLFRYMLLNRKRWGKI